MLTRLQLYEEFISHDVCMDFPKTCLQPKLIFCHYKIFFTTPIGILHVFMEYLQRSYNSLYRGKYTNVKFKYIIPCSIKCKRQNKQITVH